MASEEPAKIRSYRDLVVWQKGIALVEQVYPLSKRLPATETYALVSQMQRAAVSIPANIAEGHARYHTGDFVHHLSMALGSLAELETHLEVVVRLHFLSHQDTEPVLQATAEIGRMLHGLIQKLDLRRS